MSKVYTKYILIYKNKVFDILLYKSIFDIIYKFFELLIIIIVHLFY